MMDPSRPEDPDGEVAAGLARAVERLGGTFEQFGMPRMAARVFAYVLAEDRDRYTARELAEGLEISPAAVSGAVRYLVDIRLLLRERGPRGTRGDVFRVIDGDVWGTIIAARVPLLRHFVDTLTDAAADLAEDSRGQARVLESRDFFAFLHTDTERMLERWADRRTW